MRPAEPKLAPSSKGGAFLAFGFGQPGIDTKNSSAPWNKWRVLIVRALGRAEICYNSSLTLRRAAGRKPQPSPALKRGFFERWNCMVGQNMVDRRMRWRPTRIDDTTPQMDKCCGVKPRLHHGLPLTQISCPRCGETISTEPAPFFRDDATQREHETWRAVAVWNKVDSR